MYIRVKLVISAPNTIHMISMSVIPAATSLLHRLKKKIKNMTSVNNFAFYIRFPGFSI